MTFYQKTDDSKIWWVVHEARAYDDRFQFSFDKEKIYDLWLDYPNNMTPDEVEIFNSEEPFWADYFKDRATA